MSDARLKKEEQAGNRSFRPVATARRAGTTTAVTDTPGATVESVGANAASSDSELLSQYYHAGVQSAFSTLVQRYQAMVIATACRRVGNLELAREVAQEVFTALARKAGALKDRASLGGWLHQAAVYEAARVLQSETRRRARHERLANETTETSASTVMQSCNQSDQLAVLDEALESLSAADREAVVLHYFQDLSYSDMARAFGANEPAVRQRLSRALRRLGRQLRKRGVTGNVIAVLLSAVALQETTAVPAGLAQTALTAAAGGGGSSALALGAIFSSSKIKAVAALLTLAGAATLWRLAPADKPHSGNAHQQEIHALAAPAALDSSPSAETFSTASDADSANITISTQDVSSTDAVALAQRLNALAAAGAPAAARTGSSRPTVRTADKSNQPIQNPQSAQTPVLTPSAIFPEIPNVSTAQTPNFFNRANAPQVRTPEVIFSNILNDLAQSGRLPDLITELREAELLPQYAAELYGDLLTTVFTLDSAQRVRLDHFLQNHYERLNFEGLAGAPPSDVLQEDWFVGRQAATASAVDGVVESLPEVAPDPNVVEEVFTLVDAADVTGDTTGLTELSAPLSSVPATALAPVREDITSLQTLLPR